jgi:hypothetical protein
MKQLPSILTDPSVYRNHDPGPAKEKSTARPILWTCSPKPLKNLNPGAQLAQFFMTPETRGQIDFNTTNADVVAIPESRKLKLPLIIHTMYCATGSTALVWSS